MIPPASMILISCFGLLQLAQQPSLVAPAKPPVNDREFVPGLRIDWSIPRIEVDAKVVLRKGPLELFACSPQTREHESIVITKPRPLHLFQAMGLIGLEPGTPVRYNKDKERWDPPTGSAVRILVRYQHDRETRVDPIELWLLNVRTGKPPEPIDWIFAGSLRTEGNRFAADFDGTVICLVNFETAIISPKSLHSADNEALWLAANTDAIPEIGQSCVILIEPLIPARGIRVSVRSDGTMMRQGAEISAADIARLFPPGHEKSEKEKPEVVLAAEEGVPEDKLNAIIASLTALGLDRSWLKIEKGAPADKAVRSTPGG